MNKKTFPSGQLEPLQYKLGKLLTTGLYFSLGLVFSFVPMATAGSGSESLLPSSDLNHNAARYCDTVLSWSERDFESAQVEAQWILAQAAQVTMQQRRAVETQDLTGVRMTLSTSEAQEVEAARRQAASMLESSTSVETAMRNARKAITNVANYSGSSGDEMNRLLAEVDKAGDALFDSMQLAGDPSEIQTTEAFECNKDRRQCKAECEAEKGKKCCCGCGMTYVACILL